MQLSLLIPVRTMGACSRTCCIPDAKEPSRIGPCSFPNVNAVVAGAGAGAVTAGANAVAVVVAVPPAVVC